MLSKKQKKRIRFNRCRRSYVQNKKYLNISYNPFLMGDKLICRARYPDVSDNDKQWIIFEHGHI